MSIVQPGPKPNAKKNMSTPPGPMDGWEFCVEVDSSIIKDQNGVSPSAVWAMCLMAGATSIPLAPITSGPPGNVAQQLTETATNIWKVKIDTRPLNPVQRRFVVWYLDNTSNCFFIESRTIELIQGTITC